MAPRLNKLLETLCPTVPGVALGEYTAALLRVEPLYLGTPLRVAHFVAQWCHETGGLKYLEEIWGPTEAQKRYEPPYRLAATLGNTQKGDGYRYRGRGLCQLTGRDNYRRYGALIDRDLEGEPSLAADPLNAFYIAGEYWAHHAINVSADKDDLGAVTRAVNGGLNGLAGRARYLAMAKAFLRL
jgi:putative chitinase